MSTPITIMPSPIRAPSTNKPSGTSPSPGAGSGQFDQLLKDCMGGQQVRFSRHANERMQQRDLQMSAAQSQRLEQAMQTVGDKGGRDSLVLLDNLALVVSVPNSTVVTVSDRANLQNNVFTNIDSAVIA